MDRRPPLNLLDTHALLWATDQPELLSPAARRIVERDETAVSTASLWEILAKRNRPDAPVTDPLSWWHTHVVSRGVRILDIRWQHVRHLEALPLFHKDPFDRILLCQCLAEGLRLVTNDRLLREHYQSLVSCVW